MSITMATVDVLNQLGALERTYRVFSEVEMGNVRWIFKTNVASSGGIADCNQLNTSHFAKLIGETM